MSDFDSMWDSASALMDAAVDTLGDTILYKRAGESEFTAIKGFVIENVAGETVDEIDEIVSSIPRVKIHKSIVASPSKFDRLQHPKIGPGTYRPLGKDPQTQGRYWVFDVQKVSS
jgi:hypothetical protein